MENIKVGDKIIYPIPGVVLCRKENTVDIECEVLKVYESIKCDDGIIVDLKPLSHGLTNQISAKLLYNKQYKMGA